MTKFIPALAVIALFAVAMPAYAQETNNNITDRAVNGHGAGESHQNRDVHDGPGFVSPYQGSTRNLFRQTAGRFSRNATGECQIGVDHDVTTPGGVPVIVPCNPADESERTLLNKLH